MLYSGTHLASQALQQRVCSASLAVYSQFFAGEYLSAASRYDEMSTATSSYRTMSSHAQHYVAAQRIAILCLQALQAANVEYIVAPYEADAQMAYLAIKGKVDAVLTEDSDLLPYGCPVVSLTQACTTLSKLCSKPGLVSHPSLHMQCSVHQAHS